MDGHWWVFTFKRLRTLVRNFQKVYLLGQATNLAASKTVHGIFAVVRNFVETYFKKNELPW